MSGYEMRSPSLWMTVAYLFNWLLTTILKFDFNF